MDINQAHQYIMNHAANPHHAVNIFDNIHHPQPNQHYDPQYIHEWVEDWNIEEGDSDSEESDSEEEEGTQFLQIPKRRHIEGKQQEDTTHETGGFIPNIGLYGTLAYNAIPLRRRFSNSDEAYLKKYGSKFIKGITIYRAPLTSTVKTLLNTITLGLWEKALARVVHEGIDKVFHSFIVIDLIGGPLTIFEKNDVPTVHEWNGQVTAGTDFYQIEPFNYIGTLFDLIKTSQSDMQDGFWRYDSFNNNCIVAIRNILGVNGLLSRQADNFLSNPAKSIEKYLPSYTPQVARGITDFSRKLRTLTGKGL